jgi:hypothetical protein
LLGFLRTCSSELEDDFSRLTDAEKQTLVVEHFEGKVIKTAPIKIPSSTTQALANAKFSEVIALVRLASSH